MKPLLHIEFEQYALQFIHKNKKLPIKFYDCDYVFWVAISYNLSTVKRSDYINFYLFLIIRYSAQTVALKSQFYI